MTDKATTTTVITCLAAGTFGAWTLQEWLAVLSAICVVVTTWHSWRHRNRLYQLKLDEIAKLKDEHEP